MGCERSQDYNLYLGVDGGQTSTTAVIGDSSGRVLGTGIGGQSNHVSGPEGRIRLINAVTAAVGNACADAGVPAASVEFDAACLGFTGGIDGKEQILREILRCRLLQVTDDVTIAFFGAHGSHPGIVTIAGTGSVSMGRSAQGNVARAGGGGYAFGDEGGAWGIAREALRAALRWHEQWGPSTLLHDLFLHETGETDIHTLRRLFYTGDYPRPRVAAFSKLVDEAAHRGDTVAIDILSGAAEHLATLSNVVRTRLFAPGETVNVAYIGGVFECGIVLDEFRRRLESAYPVRVIKPLHDPCMGALLEAIRLGQAEDEQSSSRGDCDPFTPSGLKGNRTGHDVSAEIDLP
jgi:N-acetylglucosamine kinase-like BadF-type ATPase